jgi:FkbM family methyltransferase
VKMVDGWYWPDRETHLLEWIANPKNRMVLNGRAAYQGKKQVALLALCKRFRTAIDVGAHVGLWTYNLAPHFTTVRSFEPVAEHRECFVQNISADNVVLYPLALGERSDKVSIRQNESSTGDSWVEGSGDIQMEPLDAFELTDVDLIKIDAEGYEENILRGAEQTLRHSKPVLCVEQKRDFPKRWGLQPQGAITYLQSLGYVVAQEIGGDYLMTMR